MTHHDLLRGINAYPVSLHALRRAALRRGLDLTEEATSESIGSRAYRLAEADIKVWLSWAPNVAQGGQSYSFSAEERRQLRAQARQTYAELGEDDDMAGGVNYGYKGSRL